MLCGNISCLLKFVFLVPLSSSVLNLEVLGEEVKVGRGE